MKADAIIDLQFGSTGKGMLADVLAIYGGYTAAACAYSPNAGHTIRRRHGGLAAPSISVDEGETGVYVMRALPVAALSRACVEVFLGPGAAIDPEVLTQDLNTAALLRRGAPLTVCIHNGAGVVIERHKLEEAARLQGISSTMKGSSGPLLDRIHRLVGRDTRVGTQFHPMMEAFANASPQARETIRIDVVDTEHYRSRLERHDRVLLEGCQGYSLSPSAGFWPFCTYRECTVSQLLADTLIAPTEVEAVWGICRTFPIRVGSLPGTTSGGCYPDQQEQSWEDLGLDPEYTTVTKRQRRVFSFSFLQVEQAIRVNGCSHVVFNFWNYLKRYPSVEAEFMAWIRGGGAMAGRLWRTVHSGETNAAAADLDSLVQRMPF